MRERCLQIRSMCRGSLIRRRPLLGAAAARTPQIASRLESVSYATWPASETYSRARAASSAAPFSLMLPGLKFSFPVKNVRSCHADVRYFLLSELATFAEALPLLKQSPQSPTNVRLSLKAFVFWNLASPAPCGINWM